MSKIPTHQFFATTAKGMEQLLCTELSSIGALSPTVTRAGVKFQGTLETAYRACLWSRIANRILLPLKTFAAPTQERLYAGVKSIRWSDHLSPKETIAVDFSTSHSQITHSQFGALKTKDAICDQLRSVQGERPSVKVIEPDIRINVYLNNDEATVSLDLSGDSLHLRGYREDGAKAPLKENLAAAILASLGWTHDCDREELLDPMTGSGTLPLEAAMISARIAPGAARKYFGFLGWRQHDKKLWTHLLEEARDLEIHDRKKLPRIVGTDQDPRVIATAISNSERAKLTTRVHFERREFIESRPQTAKGLIVLNPPYGERLGETEDLKPLYKTIGDTFKQHFAGWRGGVFTSNPELAKCIGLKAKRRHVLFNGALECRLLEYELFAGKHPQKSSEGPLLPDPV